MFWVYEIRLTTKENRCVLLEREKSVHYPGISFIYWYGIENIVRNETYP